jgi:hypothetical protein
MRGQDLVRVKSHSQNRSRDQTLSEKILQVQQPTNPVERLDSWWDIKAAIITPADDNEDSKMSKMVQDFHKA